MFEENQHADSNDKQRKKLPYLLAQVFRALVFFKYEYACEQLYIFYRLEVQLPTP